MARILGMSIDHINNFAGEKIEKVSGEGAPEVFSAAPVRPQKHRNNLCQNRALERTGIDKLGQKRKISGLMYRFSRIRIVLRP